MEVVITARKANKEIKKKKCPICGKEKSITTGFYKSSSPLYADEGCVPICTSCVKDNVINKEDGTINLTKLKTMLQRIDKPYYVDDLDSSYKQYKKEHGFLSDDEVAKHGKDIVGIYFKNCMLRQNKDKSFADSEKDGFIHQNSNSSKQEKQRILNEYIRFGGNTSNVSNHLYDNINSTQSYTQTQSSNSNASPNQQQLIYSDEWMGEYTRQDLDRLNKYYESLNTDYKIVTVNHRDYARKIAKASLMMDKAYEDMLKGVPGAEKMYTNAKDIFDSLSKSAKFSEDKRSINDVGISSFSKIVSMVENHNWIPEYVPKNKDMYDELLDELRVINRSL